MIPSHLSGKRNAIASMEDASCHYNARETVDSASLSLLFQSFSSVFFSYSHGGCFPHTHLCFSPSVSTPPTPSLRNLFYLLPQFSTTLLHLTKVAVCHVQIAALCKMEETLTLARLPILCLIWGDRPPIFYLRKFTWSLANIQIRPLLSQ